MTSPSALLLSAPPLACIDVGNTHTHVALHHRGEFHAARDLPTAELDHPAHGLPAWLASLATSGAHPVPAVPTALAFCSVVPAATPRLRAVAAAQGLEAWQLTAEARLGLPLSYPRPAEIGQDRLANAIGAAALAPGRPAIVIDLGTAVTFDLVTPEGGYEGGIIAPGPALVTRYLHERTAQLPWVEDLSAPISGPIGRSTAEAIRIGAVIGYPGLIQALLDAVQAEFHARGLGEAELFLTGGAAPWIAERLRQPARLVPQLAALGLTLAYTRRSA
jgi:type III pantothenate kinase